MLIFVDITQVVEGIAVARIGFDSFLVPLNCLICLSFPFVDDCGIVVSTVIFGVVLDTLLVVLKGSFILLLVIISYSH